jgi:hypothetical protein
MVELGDAVCNLVCSHQGLLLLAAAGTGCWGWGRWLAAKGCHNASLLIISDSGSAARWLLLRPALAAPATTCCCRPRCCILRREPLQHCQRWHLGLQQPQRCRLLLLLLLLLLAGCTCCLHRRQRHSSISRGSSSRCWQEVFQQGRNGDARRQLRRLCSWLECNTDVEQGTRGLPCAPWPRVLPRGCY